MEAATVSERPGGPNALLRVIAWNIRSGGGTRVASIAAQLRRWRPDLVALSEFRGTPPSQELSSGLARQGLVHQRATTLWAEPRRNALLLASRWPLRRRMEKRQPSEQTRWALVRVAAPVPFWLGAMHVPNAQTGRKAPFHAAVLDLAEGWRRGPGLLVGDTNSGLPGIDEESPAFTAQEENWIRSLESLGWRDVFRHRHGNRREFTWYSPNAGNGFRLDQGFANPGAIDWVRSVRHVWGRDAKSARRDQLSDHAALILDLDPSLAPEC